MRHVFTKLSVAGIAALTTLATALPAIAQDRFTWLTQSGNTHTRNYTRVPEIDVTAGLAAVAVVGALLLLTWELRRRRNKG